MIFTLEKLAGKRRPISLLVAIFLPIEKDPNQPHIMISYQWDSQPMMIKVKDRLRHAGYKVWMDVEHMSM